MKKLTVKMLDSVANGLGKAFKKQSMFDRQESLAAELMEIGLSWLEKHYNGNFDAAWRSTCNAGGRGNKKAPLRDDSPLTCTVTLTGDAAASIRAIAYVCGMTEAEIIADICNGSDDRADNPAELLREATCNSNDVKSAAERFKRYRDTNGIDYPDFVIDADIAEERGEISMDERNLRIREAGWKKLVDA